MKFIQATSLFISGCHAAAILNPGDDPFSTYVKSSDYIVSPTKGVLSKLTSELALTEALPLTAEDYQIIDPQLSDPEILGPLFIKKEVNLDLYGLTLPPEEAKDAILVLSDLYKSTISRRISEAIRYKTQVPTKADAVNRMHVTLDRLSQVDDLEQTLLTSAGRILDDHPEYIEFTQILVKALPDTFQNDVLMYMRDFFLEANTYDMRTANKLRHTLKTLQTQYNLLPEDYYSVLSAVVSHPEDEYIFNHPELKIN